jgi:hypothetical protein
MGLFERPSSKLTRNDGTESDIVAELDKNISLKELRQYFDKVQVAIKLCPVPGTTFI